MSMNQITTILQKWSNPLAAILISSWAMVLRFQNFANRDLWTDEIWLVKHVKGPFIPFWAKAHPIDVTYFYGDYFLIYPFYKLFGESKWAMAAPHIIVTALSFLFLYLLCKRYMKTIVGYIIAFCVVCFNSQLIYHSFEIRPYAVLMMFSLASIHFWRIAIEEQFQQKKPYQYLIGLFFMTVMLFHAYGILIVSITLFYQLLKSREQESLNDLFKNNVCFISTIYLLVLPLWVRNMIFHEDSYNVWVGYVYTFQYIPNPILNFVGFLKGVFGNLIGNKIMYITLGGFVLSFLIAHKQRREQIGFFLILILLPIELIMISDVMNTFWFIQRQFVWVMPLFALLLGWQWDALYVNFRDRMDLQKNRIN